MSRYGEVALGVECALPRAAPGARRRRRALAVLALAGAALAVAFYAGTHAGKAPPPGAEPAREKQAPEDRGAGRAFPGKGGPGTGRRRPALRQVACGGACAVQSAP
jgi:hypothetical protein